MLMVGFLTHNDSDILRAKTGPYRCVGYQTNILPTVWECYDLVTCYNRGFQFYDSLLQNREKCCNMLQARTNCYELTLLHVTRVLWVKVCITRVLQAAQVHWLVLIAHHGHLVIIQIFLSNTCTSLVVLWQITIYEIVEWHWWLQCMYTNVTEEWMLL